MSEVLQSVTHTAEQVLIPLGLMQGNYAIQKRIILGGVIGAALVSWIKPTFMFSSTGMPKGWAFWHSDTDGDGLETTWFPWYGASAIGALLLGGFV